MDASLNGLGAILSQQDKDGNIQVIAYASSLFMTNLKDLCAQLQFNQTAIISTKMGCN